MKPSHPGHLRSPTNHGDNGQRSRWIGIPHLQNTLLPLNCLCKHLSLSVDSCTHSRQINLWRCPWLWWCKRSLPKRLLPNVCLQTWHAYKRRSVAVQPTSRQDLQTSLDFLFCWLFNSLLAHAFLGYLFMHASQGTMLSHSEHSKSARLLIFLALS